MPNKILANQIISKKLMAVMGLNIGLALISFLKDTLMASYLGTSISADTLFATFFLPDAIGFNILGQTASMILVPLFVWHADQEENDLQYGIAFVMSVFFSIVGVIASLLLLNIGTDVFTSISGRGDMIDVILSEKILYLLIPLLLITPIAFVNIAFLNANERYVESAIAPVLFNLWILIGVGICFVMSLDLSYGPLFIAGAIGSGALIMFTFVFSRTPDLLNIKRIKSGLAMISNNPKHWTTLFKQTLLLMLVFCIYQGVLYFERVIAYYISPGGIAALNYAYRLSQFPLWVFIAALLVVVLPELSKHVVTQTHESLYEKLHDAWLILLMIIIPVAVYLLVFREEILTALFMRGAFGMDSLKMTSNILMGYAIAIVFQSLSYLMLRVYLVYNRMSMVLKAYLCSSAANVVFDLVFYQEFGLMTIGFGAAVGWLVNMFYLFHNSEALMKHMIFNREIKVHRLIVTSNIISAILLVGLQMLFTRFFPVVPFGSMLKVILSGVIYLTVYGWILYRKKVVQTILHF